MVTRAIHLEVAQDSTALIFLHTLRRFIAREAFPRPSLPTTAKTSRQPPERPPAEGEIRQWQNWPTMNLPT
uniref:Uncharacterized protein n=1 Tax=Ditylenchus dipsaci TaxID=166011 RepID=A0A915E9E5_9BILA